MNTELTNEMKELIDREADLISRNRPHKSMERLRLRLRVDLYEEDCHFVQCRKKSEDCHFLKYTLSGDNLKFECFTWNTN